MSGRSVTQSIVLCVPIILMGLGIIMIYSSSSIVAAQRFHDGSYFIKKQFLFGTCGIISMLTVMNIPYTLFKKIAYPLWLLCVALLILVILPGIGTQVGGAVRWIRLGPVSFQPAELAKLSVIIVMAYSLAKKEPEQLFSFSIGVLPHLVFVVPLTVLILLEPDFGTAMMLIAFLFSMLFVAGVAKRYLGLLVSGGMAAAAVLVFEKAYRMERLLAFLDPWKHSDDSGFQIVQSFLAFGAGGILGTGLGRGTQKLFYLPEPHTDFILSVIGEELGFIGVVAVIALFVLFVVCGIRIALHADDLFGTYMSLGIVIMLGLQAVMNMGVVMGLLPTKGMPLPFVSYGGTALLINLVSVGMLLSVSAHSQGVSR